MKSSEAVPDALENVKGLVKEMQDIYLRVTPRPGIGLSGQS